MDKRFCQFAFSCLGKTMKLNMVDGKQSEGRFFTIQPDVGNLVLKDYWEQNSNNESEQKTKDFEIVLLDNFVSGVIEQIPSGNQQLNSPQISPVKKAKFQENKVFERWDFADKNNNEELLEDTKASIKNWDQFKANEGKIDGQDEFKEEHYTTALNKDIIPKEKIIKAKELEKELNKESCLTKHQLEERGKIPLAEEDEEKEYSAVLGTGAYRNDNNNKVQNEEQKTNDQQKLKGKQTKQAVDIQRNEQKIKQENDPKEKNNQKNLEPKKEPIPQKIEEQKQNSKDDVAKKDKINDNEQKEEQQPQQQTSNEPKKLKKKLNVNKQAFDPNTPISQANQVAQQATQLPQQPNFAQQANQVASQPNQLPQQNPITSPVSQIPQQFNQVAQQAIIQPVNQTPQPQIQQSLPLKQQQPQQFYQQWQQQQLQNDGKQFSHLRSEPDLGALSPNYQYQAQALKNPKFNNNYLPYANAQKPVLQQPYDAQNSDANFKYPTAVNQQQQMQKMQNSSPQTQKKSITSFMNSCLSNYTPTQLNSENEDPTI